MRSDGEKLAQALTESGNDVELKNWTGVTHEFFGMAAVLDEARQAQECAAARLKKALG